MIGSRRVPFPTGHAAGSFLILAGLILFGCEETTIESVEVDRIEIEPDAPQLSTGDQLQMSVAIYDADGNALSGLSAAWTSDDEDVVQVSATGMVQAIGPGSTRVQVTVAGRSAETTVTVLAPASIVLDRDSATFAAVAGGAEPADVPVQVTNGGDGTLSGLTTAITYDGATTGWLQALLDVTTAPAEMTLRARGSTLDGGTYTATVVVSSPAAANTDSVEVTLVVQQNAPAAPTGLQISGSTDSTAALLWADNSIEETEFRIERRAPGASTFSLLVTLGPNRTAYTDSTVALDGTYTYRVSACNAAGCSDYSNESSVIMRPTAPTGIGVTATSGSAITVDWSDASATETEFRIERRTGTAAFQQIGSLGANVETFSDTGLQDGVRYEYRVRACNPGGCSDYSAIAAASTPLTPPSALAVDTIAAAFAAVIWSDNSGTEAEFRIERSSGGGAYLQAGIVGADTMRFVDMAVEGDSTYSYRVRACNATGCSAYSNTTSAAMPPVAPTGLTTAVTGPGVRLDWADNASTETGYEVQRNDGNGFTSLASLSAGTTGYDDTTAAAGQPYAYRVRACNASGCSAWSNTASVGSLPTPPDGLTATTFQGAVNLSWNLSPSPAAYQEIERNDGTGWSLLRQILPNLTTFGDTTVTPETVYSYRIRTCDSSDLCSFPSDTAMVLTPPGGPTNLAVVLVTADSVRLTWTDNGTIETGFSIQRRSPTGTYTVVGNTGANVETFTDLMVEGDSTYVYKVQACNGTDCSKFSNTATAAMPPAAPDNLGAAYNAGSGEIDLTWNDNSSTETGFEIYRDAGSGSTLLTTVGADVESYSDGSVNPDATYGYEVRACSGAGCSAFSGTASASTGPAAPTNLTATAITSSQIDLDWTDNSSTENRYEVDRSLDGGTTWALLVTLGPDMEFHSDIGLTALTMYTYRVRACSSVACSANAGPVSATTGQVSPPAAPGALLANPASPTQVDLSWNDVATETRYEVARSSNGGTTYTTLDANLAVNSTAYADNNATDGTAYVYRVSACNAGGCTPATDAATTAVAAPSGLGATAVSASQIDLAWTDNSASEAEQIIQRRTSAGGTYADIDTVAANVATYSDTGLTGNTGYDYRVAACNTTGCSAWSNTASATTSQAAPAAPGNLSATAASPTQVNLTWTDVANETYYEVDRSDNGGTTYTPLDSLAAGTTSYADNGATDGTAYTYRVSACNAGGCTPATDAVTTPVAAPSGLGASAVSTSQIDLAWTDNSATEVDQVIQRRVSGGSFAVIDTAAANATSYSDTGLTSNTTYEYRVEACNATGCSAFSNTASAATQQAAPAAPGSLTATAASPTQVNLSWTDVATETRYEVERSSNGGTTWTSLNANVAAGTTAYADNGATDGTAYTYRVSACNAAGCTPATDAVTTPVAAPSALGATAVSTSQIDLTWTDNSASEIDQIIQRRVSGGSFADIDTVAANVATYSDTGLTDNTAYDYRVTACNTTGCSAFSNTASATTPQAPPAAPGSLNATAVSPTQVNLTWSDVASETRYEVERSDDGGTTYTPLNTSLAAGTTAYTDNTASDGTAYTYRVSACNSGGCTPATDAVTTPVAVPINLNASTVSHSEIDLDWTEVSATATEQIIQRRISGMYNAIDTVAAGVSSYSDTGLAASTTYEYRIAACNTTGCSNWSSSASATTLQAPPAAPGSLNATAASPTQVNLSWTDVATETRYEVERSDNGGTTYTTLDANLAAGSTAYTDNGATDGTAYVYRVSACNAGGCTPATDAVTTPVAAPSGLGATPISSTEIDLAWTDNSATETGFELERLDPGQGSFSQIATPAANIESYPDTGLLVDSDYDYRVRACNATGCSAWSSTANATTLTIPAPSGLGVTLVTAPLSLDLSWNDNAQDETRYEVQRGDAAGANFTDLTTSLAANIETYPDATVALDTAYSYRVRACNAGGCSQYSGIASDSTPPAAPGNLTAVPGRAGTIDLAWDNNSSFSGVEFEIERDDAGAGFNYINSVFAPTVIYNDDDAALVVGVSYTYRIRACNGSVCSAYSNQATSSPQ